MTEPWKVPNAHAKVLANISEGRGAWHGAEKPMQRGHRSGLLQDLRFHGLIYWTKNDAGLARYFVTEAGAAAIATGATHD